MALPASATAQTPPPACAAGVALTPTIKAVDSDDGGRGASLTATHVIVVSATFPNNGQASADTETTKWTGPAGIPMLTHRSRNAEDLGIGDETAVGFAPTVGGPLAVTVTWQQADVQTGATCTGSANASFIVQTAKRLRPSAPRGTSCRTCYDEFNWFINVRPDTDRRPLVIRLRSVRGAHLPGPRVPFKTTTVALRPSDAGYRARRELHVRFIDLYPSFGGSTIQLLVDLDRHLTSNPKLGFELELRQGTHRVGRIRAAGRCGAFGCEFSPFSVQR